MATARMPKITGAFHGAIPKHTPAGTGIANANAPGLSEGMTSPRIWDVMPAASRSILAPRWTLKAAHPGVAPISAAIARAKSAALSSTASAALSSSARRFDGDESDQDPNAPSAALQASTTSSSVDAAATEATESPFGVQRSKTAPELDGLLFPLIRSSITP